MTAAPAYTGYAADARRRKEQSRKILPTKAASSLQDVAYEARRELTERRPGARIEEKLPGIGPALDKLAHGKAAGCVVAESLSAAELTAYAAALPAHTGLCLLVLVLRRMDLVWIIRWVRCF